MSEMSVEENLRLMKTLDDAWNAQDWETFNKRHTHNVTVYWPGQPDPTRGIHSHTDEAAEFFKTFLTTMLRMIPIGSCLVRAIGLVQSRNLRAR
jgi:hypothetical protein